VKRIFISDCEGPISKNDDAFEATAHFVPNGDKLFTIISRYDDVLAEVLKRPSYKAGDTLKLVLPFLKAYDVTDQKMCKFAKENLVLIPSIKHTLRHVQHLAPSFIISTSYEHYLKALCQAVNFPFQNTYCTRLSLDKYTVAEKEKTQVKQMAREIAQMPEFEITTETKSLKEFSQEAQTAIRRLDDIFWNEIAGMRVGRIYSEVNPIGGSGKAEAIKDVVQKLAARLQDVMYVGDSITDEEAFKLVRKNGGLTVSFNGNQYAVRNAEIAALSENSLVTAIIADAFVRFGKPEALSLVKHWSRRALEESSVNKALLDRFFSLYPSDLPKVKITTSENIEALAKESSEFRNHVRGEDIGRLG